MKKLADRISRTYWISSLIGIVLIIVLLFLHKDRTYLGSFLLVLWLILVSFGMMRGLAALMTLQPGESSKTMRRLEKWMEAFSDEKKVMNRGTIVIVLTVVINLGLPILLTQL